MVQFKARLGETAIILEDYGQDSNISKLYSLVSKQKIDNMEVDCKYFENKGINGCKKFNLTVTITKYTTKNNYRFEIYATTVNPEKYNHVCRVVKEQNMPLSYSSKAYGIYMECLEDIHSKGDKFTLDFINCANELLNDSNALTQIPEFIKNTIDEVKENNVVSFNNAK